MRMIEYENLYKLNKPFMEAYARQFSKVSNSGSFVLGKQVSEFEEKFARYCKSGFAIGVANGLDALTLALKSFSFKAGSEVIVPSNTYIATILSVLNSNLKPVLVEPDIHTYNLDPAKIEAAITPKTVAIMVVHLYGKCCDMDPIMEITRRRGLKLVEDCAQSHGAKYKSRKAGTFGDFGAFSFYPTKNLGALGDAGALTTESKELNSIVRKLRNYGAEKKYYNDLVGCNSRLDEIQAAFLTIKLIHLEAINDHKRKLAKIYTTQLKDHFIKPVVQSGYEDVYHIYNIRHPRRDALRKYLLKHEVESEIHYPVPPHRQAAMQGILDKYDCPLSDEIHQTTLSLPISYFHTEKNVHRVVDILNKF